MVLGINKLLTKLSVPNDLNHSLKRCILACWSGQIRWYRNFIDNVEIFNMSLTRIRNSLTFMKGFINEVCPSTSRHGNHLVTIKLIWRNVGVNDIIYSP